MLQLIARTTAYLNRVFVAVCDRGGHERGLDFQGGSVIAAPGGGSVPSGRRARLGRTDAARRLRPGGRRATSAPAHATTRSATAGRSITPRSYLAENFKCAVSLE